jgi:hypothetical protein
MDDDASRAHARKRQVMAREADARRSVSHGREDVAVSADPFESVVGKPGAGRKGSEVEAAPVRPVPGTTIT